MTDSMCNGGRCACSANMYLDGTTCLNSKLEMVTHLYPDVSK